MSRIDDLIKEHCPNGVEYKALGEIAEVGTGGSDRKHEAAEGEFPFYVRSRDVLRINSYEFDEEAVIIPGEGGIGDIFHYVSGKYGLHQRAYRIHFTSCQVDTKFAYYYLSAYFKRFILGKAVNATVSSIRKPMITAFRLPVPPLVVQREIVNILDKMEALTAELQAELQARASQYAYCRDALLSFSDETSETPPPIPIDRSVDDDG